MSAVPTARAPNKPTPPSCWCHADGCLHYCCHNLTSHGMHSRQTWPSLPPGPQRAACPSVLPSARPIDIEPSQPQSPRPKALIFRTPLFILTRTNKPVVGVGCVCEKHHHHPTSGEEQNRNQDPCRISDRGTSILTLCERNTHTLNRPTTGNKLRTRSIDQRGPRPAALATKREGFTGRHQRYAGQDMESTPPPNQANKSAD